MGSQRESDTTEFPARAHLTVLNLKLRPEPSNPRLWLPKLRLCSQHTLPPLLGTPEAEIFPLHLVHFASTRWRPRPGLPHPRIPPPLHRRAYLDQFRRWEMSYRSSLSFPGEVPDLITGRPRPKKVRAQSFESISAAVRLCVLGQLPSSPWT